MYLEDNNANVHKRTFENGLSETLDFNLRYAGDFVSLKLRENKRLNANAPIYEEVTLADGTKKIQRNINIPSNKVCNHNQGAIARSVSYTVDSVSDLYRGRPAIDPHVPDTFLQ